MTPTVFARDDHPTPPLLGGLPSPRSEQTKAGIARSKALRRRFGQIPFGLQLADDGIHLIDDAAEQGTLARIVRLHSEGATLTGIADGLNRSGIPAKQGGRWLPSTVQNLLRRRVRRAARPESDPVDPRPTRRRERIGPFAADMRVQARILRECRSGGRFTLPERP